MSSKILSNYSKDNLLEKGNLRLVVQQAMSLPDYD